MRSGRQKTENGFAERDGLGGETAIASLEIRWPSGIVQTLKKVLADQIPTVTEPAR